MKIKRTEMKTALAHLEIKTVKQSRKKTVIEGVATTPTMDRMKDTVDPEGVQYKLPIPLLMHHNHRQPVGLVKSVKVSKNGISFVAELADPQNDGELKKRVDEARDTLEAGLFRGVSIGFRSLRTAFNDDGGLDFLEWDWFELSLVTVPANEQATIDAIKAYAKASAPLGKESRASAIHQKSPVGGVVKIGQHTGESDMSIAEQIAKLKQEKAAAESEADEIQTKAMDAGETKSEEDRKRYREL